MSEETDVKKMKGKIVVSIDFLSAAASFFDCVKNGVSNIMHTRECDIFLSKFLYL